MAKREYSASGISDTDDNSENTKRQKIASSVDEDMEIYEYPVPWSTFDYNAKIIMRQGIRTLVLLCHTTQLIAFPYFRAKFRLNKPDGGGSIVLIDMKDDEFDLREFIFVIHSAYNVCTLASKEYEKHDDKLTFVSEHITEDLDGKKIWDIMLFLNSTDILGLWNSMKDVNVWRSDIFASMFICHCEITSEENIRMLKILHKYYVCKDNSYYMLSKCYYALRPFLQRELMGYKQIELMNNILNWAILVCGLLDVENGFDNYGKSMFCNFVRLIYQLKSSEWLKNLPDDLELKRTFLENLNTIRLFLPCGIHVSHDMFSGYFECCCFLVNNPKDSAPTHFAIPYDLIKYKHLDNQKIIISRLLMPIFFEICISFPHGDVSKLDVCLKCNELDKQDLIKENVTSDDNDNVNGILLSSFFEIELREKKLKHEVDKIRFTICSSFKLKWK